MEKSGYVSELIADGSDEAEERRRRGGRDDGHDEALGRHAELVPEVRRHFQRLRPERYRRVHGLDGDFKLNIEANHATLAGHSFSHELQVAAADRKSVV